MERKCNDIYVGSMSNYYLTIHIYVYTYLIVSFHCSQITSMMFNGRYLMLLMSLFALYAGWVYNDCLSLSINAFGTQYSFVDNELKAKKLV